MQKKLIKKNKFNWFFSLMFSFLLFAFLIWMFFSNFWIEENKLTFGGSSSVFPLMVNLQKEISNSKKSQIEKYKNLKKYRYISSGSSAAAWGVVTKKFDIGFSSKVISDSNLNELFKGTEYNSKDLNKFQLAEDKIIFLMNLPNGCTGQNLNLTQKIIQEIYKGSKKWDSLEEVTCKDKEIKIKPFNRQEGSGTRSKFENEFMKDINYDDIKILKSGTAIFKYIFSNRNAFGYISKSKISKIKKKIDNQDNLIIPKINSFDFENDLYEFKRPFIGLYLKKNKDKLSDFLNFLQNDCKKWINDFGFDFKWKVIND